MSIWRLLLFITLLFITLLAIPLRARAQSGHRSDASLAQSDATDSGDYVAQQEMIEAKRADLAREYRGAEDEATRAAVLDRASQYLAVSISRDLLPRWLAMPWGQGANSVAQRPDASGKTVNCGSFVIAVLEGAGFRVPHRHRLAQAPALRILEAVGAEATIVRWRGSVPALERQLRRWGDGVYLIGLASHIGFVVVSRDTVSLVHASKVVGQVAAQRLLSSPALRRSRQTDFFVAALGSHRMSARSLVSRWLNEIPIGPR
jgi:hypothetical protein